MRVLKLKRKHIGDRRVWLDTPEWQNLDNAKKLFAEIQSSTWISFFELYGGFGKTRHRCSSCRGRFQSATHAPPEKKEKKASTSLSINNTEANLRIKEPLLGSHKTWIQTDIQLQAEKGKSPFLTTAFLFPLFLEPLRFFENFFTCMLWWIKGISAAIWKNKKKSWSPSLFHLPTAAIRSSFQCFLPNEKSSIKDRLKIFVWLIFCHWEFFFFKFAFLNEKKAAEATGRVYKSSEN